MQIDLTPGTAGEIFLYQDSRKSGSVHRFVATLTMHVQKEVLEQAVRELMPRFPYFSVGVRKSGEALEFVRLDTPVPVSGAGGMEEELPAAGSKGLAGYLFRISFLHKTVFFDWHLSLSDGKGMLEFVKAVIFRYIQLCGFPIANDGTVKEADESANAVEGMDPFERLDDIPASRPLWYMDAKAFCLPQDSGTGPDTVHVTQVRIPVVKVKGQVREYLTQPESFISPLFAHALYERYSSEIRQGEYIVSAIKENLRPHFPTASLRSYFSPVSLAYNRKVDEYPFGTILMSQKKLLDAQLKQDAIAYSAKRLIETVEHACQEEVPFSEKLARAGKSMDAASRTATFSICNVGNIAMPDSLLQYMTELYPIVPAGSYASSLSVVNFKGDIVITVTDRVPEDNLAARFAELLNRHDIPAFVSDRYQFTQISYSPEKTAEDNG